MGIGFEAALIVLLVIGNGLFAMSEIAIVSARRARLQKLAGKGNAGAAAAIELSAAPNQFLSTVQIGITLVGTLAGAFGGATLAKELAIVLAPLPVIGAHSQAVAFGTVVAGISYLSLILGELVPKRIALNAPERIASMAAPPMKFISRAASPIVRFLSFSTDLVLKLLPFRMHADPAVTEDEVRGMIALGTDSGVFRHEERDLVEGVFRLGDRRTVDLMTLRSRVVWIDLDKPLSDALNIVQSFPYSRFPVARRTLDRVAGYVEARDLIGVETEPGGLAARVKKPLFVPEAFPGLRLIERFRTSRTPVAIVVDEHGQVMGMVTPTDLLVAIVGELPRFEENLEPKLVRREDGSLLLDGLMTIDELKEVLEVEEIGEAERNYNTLGGLVMQEVGRIPSIGDRFELAGYNFEVVDMDGRRVDRVLVSRTLPT